MAPHGCTIAGRYVHSPTVADQPGRETPNQLQYIIQHLHQTKGVSLHEVVMDYLHMTSYLILLPHNLRLIVQVRGGSVHSSTQGIFTIESNLNQEASLLLYVLLHGSFVNT